MTFMGSIQYLHLAPPPRFKDTDATYQDVASLCKRFGGEIINLYPFTRPVSWIPPLLYGWHQYRRLVHPSKVPAVHHIFAPSLGNFIVLSHLRKPVIFTLATTVSLPIRRPILNLLKNFAGIVVNNRRSKEALESVGLSNVHFIPVGIDITRFSKQRLTLQTDLHLLMASAPWEPAQFASKGIDLLLDAMTSLPRLRMTFLWRGLLVKEMQQRIMRSGLEDRITFINEEVVISHLLEKVHGTVLLANSERVVKAYPHSLVESLLCGKPIITSSKIAISEIVQAHKAGLILSDFKREALVKVIEAFQHNYQQLAECAFQFPQEAFDREQMFKKYDALYQTIAGVPKGSNVK